MVSSNEGTKEYPKRLFSENEMPTQEKSMNHNCHLVNICRLRAELGEDVWLDLHNSPLGVISKFCEIKFTYWNKIVHYFLTHQLVTNMEHELWSLVEGHPIRFSLHEFSEITQLNCQPFSNVEDSEVSHRDFWDEIQVPHSVGPSYDNLQAVFGRCQFWSFEKRRMLAWLSILSVVILVVSHSTRIPLGFAKLVLDPERFLRFPWGRVAFSSLVSGVKCARFDTGKSYVVRGFVHVLHIWALESVPVLGELYGKRREGAAIPLLSYSGSRPHLNWEKVVAVEKANHGQVRVRKMVVKPAEEMYPVWEEDEVKDPKVVQLIQDILVDQVDEELFDQGCAKDNAKKRKMKKGGEDKACEEGTAEKRARKTLDLGDDTAGKENIGKGPSDDFTDSSMHGIVKVMETLGKQVMEMNENLPTKVAMGLDAVIDARLEARFGHVRTDLEKQIASLKDEVNRLQEKLPPGEPSNHTPSDAHSEDDSRSHNSSGGAKEPKTNFQDIPLVSVLKKNTDGGKKKPVKKPVFKELESKGGKEETVKKGEVKKGLGQETKVKKAENEEKQKGVKEDEVKEKRGLKVNKDKKGVKEEPRKKVVKEKEIPREPEVKPATKPTRGRPKKQVKQVQKPQAKATKNSSQDVEVSKGDEKKESKATRENVCNRGGL